MIVWMMWLYAWEDLLCIYGGFYGINGRRMSFGWIVHACMFLVISCDLLNESLCFLYPNVDRLDIYIWVYGLCILVACAGTGGHFHLGWFLDCSVLGLNARLVRHTKIFRYAVFAPDCGFKLWFGRPLENGLPNQDRGAFSGLWFGRPFQNGLLNQCLGFFLRCLWVRFWGGFIW